MIEHERAIIGSVLLDERVLPDVLAFVDPIDFQDRRLAKILAGCHAMRKAGEPVDVLTVSARLDEWGVNGITPVDLHQMVDETPTATSATFYARLTREDALRRSMVQEAEKLRERAVSEPLGGIRATIDDLHALLDRDKPADTTLYSPEELLQQPTDYDWVIEGLLERRERVMVTAAEGYGKTTFIRQLTMTAAAGVHPFRHYQSVTPRRVLYIDAENTITQWGRKMREFGALLGDTRDVFNENFRLKPIARCDLTQPRDLANIHAYMDDHQPDIVAIGPLYRLIPRAIQNDDDAAPLLAALDTLRDRGTALVIEAHAAKALDQAGNRSLAPRGSAAMLGWPEFGLGIRPIKGETNLAELVRWRGDRDERNWPKQLIRGGSRDDLPWQIDPTPRY